MRLEAFRINSIPDHLTENEGLLPARMNPLPDELLSSWLIRLAMAHGLKLHSFCVELFGRETSIWNRDIDKLAKKQVLEILSSRTGIPFERIFQTTLADYAGKIYESHNALGNTSWIMPLRIYHRHHRRNGLQFCPICLREDSEPYYRREWRLSWISICDKHEILLLDRCPGCSEPIVFHRQEMGNRNQHVAFSITECSFCETVWTTQKSLSSCLKATVPAVRFQKSLKGIATANWGEIPGFGMVHSISYFKGLKQMLRILSVGSRSARFREEVARRSGIKLERKVEQMNFDLLPVEKRYQALQAANWLIESWAEEFIEIAKRTKTWSSVLSPQDIDIPFWYWSVVYENLSRSSYGPSEEEINSALSLLEKQNKIQGKLILPLHLKLFMQNRDILHKKSRKFKISIYKRMENYNKHIFAECTSTLKNAHILNKPIINRQIYERYQSILSNSLKKLFIKERPM